MSPGFCPCWKKRSTVRIPPSGKRTSPCRLQTGPNWAIRRVPRIDRSIWTDWLSRSGSKSTFFSSCVVLFLSVEVLSPAVVSGSPALPKGLSGAAAVGSVDSSGAEPLAGLCSASSVLGGGGNGPVVNEANARLTRG